MCLFTWGTLALLAVVDVPSRVDARGQNGATRLMRHPLGDRHEQPRHTNMGGQADSVRIANVDPGGLVEIQGHRARGGPNNSLIRASKKPVKSTSPDRLTLVKTAPPDGITQCENRGYKEKECREVGCCEFDNGFCWSLVRDKPCVVQPFPQVVVATLKLKVNSPAAFAADMHAMEVLEESFARSADVNTDLVSVSMKCTSLCSGRFERVPRCISECKAWQGLIKNARTLPHQAKLCEIYSWCEGPSCDRELGVGALQKYVSNDCASKQGTVEATFRVSVPQEQRVKDLARRLSDNDDTETVVRRAEIIYRRLIQSDVVSIKATEPMTYGIADADENEDDLYQDDVLFDFEIANLRWDILPKETREAIQLEIEMVFADITSMTEVRDVEVKMKDHLAAKTVLVFCQIPVNSTRKASRVGATLESRKASKALIDMMEGISTLAHASYNEYNVTEEGEISHEELERLKVELLYFIPGSTAIVKSKRPKYEDLPPRPEEQGWKAFVKEWLELNVTNDEPSRLSELVKDLPDFRMSPQQEMEFFGSSMLLGCVFGYFLIVHYCKPRYAPRVKPPEAVAVEDDD